MDKKLILIILSTMFIWVCVPSAHQATAKTLDQIIEGAKKEGTISAQLRTGFTPRSMDRLQKEINERFGVNLRIQFTPVRSMPRELAQAIMEYKSGAPPSYDLMTFSSHVAQGSEGGCQVYI